MFASRKKKQYDCGWREEEKGQIEKVYNNRGKVDYIENEDKRRLIGLESLS